MSKRIVALYSICLLYCSLPLSSGKVVTETSCTGRTNGRTIDLRSLSRNDGKPRFNIKAEGIHFSYNPCQSFNEPFIDPYSGSGDRCLYVMICRAENDTIDRKYYTLALENTAKFVFVRTPDIKDNEENEDVARLKTVVSEMQNLKEDDDEDSDETKDDDSEETYGQADDEENESEEEEDPSLESDNVIDVHLESKSHERPNRSRITRGIPKRLAIRFKGAWTYKEQRAFIVLTCAPMLMRPEQAEFLYLASVKSKSYFELRHQCCCPGACDMEYRKLNSELIHEKAVPEQTYIRNDSTIISSEEKYALGPGPSHLWIIVLVNAGIIFLAISIAAFCCRRSGGSGKSGSYYNYLPAVQQIVKDVKEVSTATYKALHGSQYTLYDENGQYKSASKLRRSSNVSPDQLDYSSSLHVNSKLEMPAGVLIPTKELDIGQRLGGGLYSDTYLAHWKKQVVAAKRITVGVHQNQLNEEDYQWVLKEISHLGKQRHKALVTVLGLSNDGRQPFVINEFVEGESLKDVLKRQDDEQFLTWQEKLKFLMQAADGMAFLHSAKRPVLHRDLRCANILVNKSAKLKIVDFGMTRIVQHLRMQCTGRKGCYCRKESSAFPASIRWSAPEILDNPQVDESSGVFTAACDVYAFSMVMWEVAVTGDPFEEVMDEGDVLEIVRSGGRPKMETIGGWIPQYRELMRACWDHNKENRPNMKQVAVHLKTVLQMTGKLGSQRPRKRNSSTTSYLRSALNFPDV